MPDGDLDIFLVTDLKLSKYYEKTRNLNSKSGCPLLKHSNFIYMLSGIK